MRKLAELLDKEVTWDGNTKTAGVNDKITIIATSSDEMKRIDFDNGYYYGYVLNGVLHGAGTYNWEDGSMYIGEFRNGLRHGWGTYTFKDGSKYVGMWQNDLQHGKGTYTFANGETLTGEWKNGEFFKNEKELVESSINLLKLYSKISECYNSLSQLGDLIEATSTGLSFAAREIILVDKVEKYKEVRNDFEKIIELYNTSLEYYTICVLEAKKAGIDVSNVNNIIELYKDAIESYDLAFLKLLEFSLDKTDEKMNDYLRQEENAYENIKQAKKVALDNYYLYYNMIQNYMMK